jgi:hypothetical protein
VARAFVRLSLFLALLASAPALAEDAALYWTDRALGEVRRLDLDSKEVQTLVTGLPGPQGIAVDRVEGVVYWADTTSRAIMRCSLDGSRPQTVIRLDGFPKGLDVDPDGRAVYWADPVLREISRYRLDDGVVELVATGIGIPQDVRYDARSNRVVWIESSDGIFSLPVTQPPQPASEARLVTPDFVGSATVFTIADDRARVYWGAAQKLRSIGLFGDCFERLDPIVGTVKGIDFDVTSGRLYWIEEEGGAIYSADADGGEVELVLAGEPEPWRIAVGPAQVAPRIVESPESDLVELGDVAELRVSATAGAALDFQWRRDGEPIEDGGPYRGAHTATLRITGFGPLEVGRYDCVVTSGGAEATSPPAVLGLSREAVDPAAEGVPASLWRRLVEAISDGQP